MYQSVTSPVRVTRRYHDGSSYERGASADDIKTFFGLLPSEKWPKEGFKSQVIQGITIYVLPLKDKVPTDTHWGTRMVRPKGTLHSRCMAVCPTCGKHVSYGRLAQHIGFMHT